MVISITVLDYSISQMVYLSIYKSYNYNLNGAIYNLNRLII